MAFNLLLHFSILTDNSILISEMEYERSTTVVVQSGPNLFLTRCQILTKEFWLLLYAWATISAHISTSLSSLIEISAI